MNITQNDSVLIKDNVKVMQEYFNRVYVRKTAIHSIWIPAHLSLFKAHARPPTGKDLIAFDNEVERKKSERRNRHWDVKSFKLTFDNITPAELKRAEEPIAKKEILVADEILKRH